MLTLGCVILLIHSMLYLAYTQSRERNAHTHSYSHSHSHSHSHLHSHSHAHTRTAKCISFLSFIIKHDMQNLYLEIMQSKIILGCCICLGAQWFIRVNEFNSNNKQFITSTTMHSCHGWVTAEKSR